MNRIAYCLTCFVISLTLLHAQQEPPLCFTDTFEDASSLANWRKGVGGEAEITDEGHVKLGDANVAALNFQRPDGSGDYHYADFHITVELEYVNSTSNDTAIFARGQPDSVASYIFFLNNGSALQIMRISDGGGFNIIGSASVAAPETDWIRYEFIGKGSELTGRAYTLDAPDEPLAEVVATDSTFASGRVGFSKIAGPPSIEFDNFRVLDPNDPGSCDADASTEQESNDPCFTDTFDDESSLTNWRKPNNGTIDVTDEGRLKLGGANVAGTSFVRADGSGAYQFTDFHISVELEYVNSISNDTAIFGRGQPGSSASYIFFLNNGVALQIMRISDSGGFNIIGSTGVSAPEADWIRYEFIGRGSELIGRAYTLGAPDVPLAEVVATDSTYASGSVGFAKIAGPSSIEFDNFRVLDPNDPTGCDASEPEPAPCLTNTFGNAESLTNWAVHKSSNELQISPDRKLLIEGGLAGGAFPTETTYADFYLEVDLNYVSGGPPDYGVFARITRHDNETADGYFFLINNGSLQILRLQNDQPAALVGQASPSQTLESGWLRLVFTGVGDQLTGRVYALDDPDTPLGEVSGNDSTHDSGLILLGGANSSGFRVEYDNFRVFDPNNAEGCDELIQDVDLTTVVVVKGNGTIDGLATVPAGETVTLTAKPADEHQFDHWEGIELEDQTSPSISFVANPDLSITAHFSPFPPAEPLSITNIFRTGDRTMRMEVAGTALNEDYLVEASKDLLSWQTRQRFQGDTVSLTTDGAPSEHYRVRPAENPDYQDEVGDWLGGGWHGLTDILRDENGELVPDQANNLVMFTSDGQFMASTSAELGNAVTFIPNPFGEEPAFLPYSLQGVHTAIYGNWNATGPDSFEAYGSWLYHRNEDYDSPPISPAPLDLVGRVWIQGQRTDAGLELSSRFAIDRCTEEDGCPDPTALLVSFEEAPGPASPPAVYHRLDPIVDEDPGHRAAVAAKLTGTWSGPNQVWVVGPDGQPLQEDVVNLAQFTADGGIMFGAAGEIGRRVRWLGENTTFSIEGTHTAMFGNWKATGPDSFEGFVTWLYHRPSENLTLSGVLYLSGTLTEDSLVTRGKLTYYDCQGNNCGDLSEGIVRADDFEAPFSAEITYQRLAPPQIEDTSHHAMVAEKVSGTWHAHGPLAPIPNSLFRFSADGTAMMSTSVELGQSILAIANPGIEGLPEELPFSAQGSSAAAYGSWKATGPDTFEVYMASLGHRDEPFEPVAINPGNLRMTARVYLQGTFEGDHLVITPKFTFDPCLPGACPDPAELAMPFDEVNLPTGMPARVYRLEVR